MVLLDFCAPSLIYLVFGLVQVCLDVYQGYYNMALMKIFVTIVFTLLLNAMCLTGMTVLAWMIIAIPFILMSVIISMLLFVFGLNPKTGRVMNTVNGVNYNDISQAQKINEYNAAKNSYDEDDKKVIDAREYELLYGEDDTKLSKDELIYLWNRRFIYDEDYKYEKDASGNSTLLLNSDYIHNALGDNYGSRGYNAFPTRLQIVNKKIKFKLGNNIPREISFLNNNRVKLNSEMGFYFVMGNIVNVNDTIKFIFPNTKIKVGDSIEVYNNNKKLRSNMNIISIENA